MCSDAEREEIRQQFAAAAAEMEKLETPSQPALTKVEKKL